MTNLERVQAVECAPQIPAKSDGCGSTQSLWRIRGTRFRNEVIFAGSDLPVAGSGAEANNGRENPVPSGRGIPGYCSFPCAIPRHPAAGTAGPCYAPSLPHPPRRLAACEGERSDDRHPPLAKHDRPRQHAPLPVALEISTHAHAFGVVAAESGVRSIDFLKRVHHPCRRQPMRREPSCGVRNNAPSPASANPIAPSRTKREAPLSGGKGAGVNRCRSAAFMSWLQYY